MEEEELVGNYLLHQLLEIPGVYPTVTGNSECFPLNVRKLSTFDLLLNILGNLLY